MATRAVRPCNKPDTVGLKHGFRSGFEHKIYAELEAAKVQFGYECEKIAYTIPASAHTYTPDFVITFKDSGKKLYIETKGRFLTEDRQKHLHIKRDNPSLDIRFIFQNPHAKISSSSKTTYADWCNKHGFRWGSKNVPKEWLLENA